MAKYDASSATEWSISNDIYSIVEAVDNLKKRYVEDENETTLAIGIFGFLGDTEAKKIQTSVVMAGELGNEMFAQRAKLDKNIITHAMYCNIEHINAVPASIITTLMIKEEDLDAMMVDNKFLLDHNCPIYIEDYEFHLDYDVLIKRVKNTQREDEEWIYTATYQGLEDPNTLSDIKTPYLAHPFRIFYDNYMYISTQCTIRQVTIETTEDKMITDSLINNKSYVFTFDNQLADFTVYVTEYGTTKRLTPVPYGAALDLNTLDYCWYMYINDTTVRITFDAASYIPGLNADIKIVAQTTLGAEGNFKSKVAEDIDIDGYFVDFESPYYKYRTMTVYVRPASDSVGGSNKKSVEELKSLIPKMLMSRGYITTETDLNNYFNLISTDENRLKLQKKVDNQLQRIWYCYMLMKDDYNNIIPTNTLPIKIDINMDTQHEDILVIPAGTVFIYDKDQNFATPIDENFVPPEPYSDDYYNNDGLYYYRLVYTIIINRNPLFCSYMMNIADKQGYFTFDWLNSLVVMGFLINTYKFKRELLNPNKRNTYTFEFGTQQSVKEDFKLYYTYTDTETGHEVVVNNMKAFLVFYQKPDVEDYDEDDAPYRYVEAELVDVDIANYVYRWKCSFNTDNEYDSKFRLKLTDVIEVGTGVQNHGYFEDNVKARVFLYAKYPQEYGRHDADAIIPNMDGYTLVNIYSVDNGIDLCNNFTRVMNTRIRKIVSPDGSTGYYNISGIPFVGYHYLSGDYDTDEYGNRAYIDEEHVSYFINKLLEKKAYIDNCLKVLENNMDIDFKYYNTYGWSKTYGIAFKEGAPIQGGALGNIDITLKFRAKLTNSNDTSTKDAIIRYIKEYIEDLNETGDLHTPNLIHDIKEHFGDSIVYIEFINFNDNDPGINHIELKYVDDIHTVPEFINVRNKWNVDRTALEPCIELEIVT